MSGDLLSISQAAAELDLDPSRVRALAAKGALAGRKVGDRWLIERKSVNRRKLAPRGAGRPFEPHNAWALIFLASGQDPQWLSAPALSRLRRILRQDGIAALRPRLVRRADPRRFSAHPGELAHLLEDRMLVPSGVNAASGHGLELVSGSEVDGYVRAGALDDLCRRHALRPPLPGEGNVLLRVVPDSAWNLDLGDRIAPIAAVALDLADDPDPRSARVGAGVLGRLDESRS